MVCLVCGCLYVRVGVFCFAVVSGFVCFVVSYVAEFVGLCPGLS